MTKTDATMDNEVFPRGCDTETIDCTIRPQDDLFRFINGNWLKTHVLPDDKAMDGAFHTLRDESEKQRRDIIEQCVDHTITSGKAREIAQLYSAFMDETKVEEAGMNPLLPLFTQVDQSQTRDDLAQLLGELMRIADAPFPAAGVGVDPNNPERYVFMLSQGGLGLPDESYYREESYKPIREAYVEYIAKIFGLAGFEDAPQRAAKLMDFETKLAKTHWDNVATRDTDKTNNPMSWPDVKALAPDFNWEGWARKAALDTADLASVIVGIPPHIEGFGKLWRETDMELLRDWIKITLLTTYAPLLSSDFVETRFDFYSRTLTGTQKLRERWKRGVGFVESHLGEPLGKLYVERHFPADHKQKMVRLVDYLIEAYRSSITDLDWMSEETKAKALEKLSQFRTKIGYPDQWRDYSALHFSENDTLIDMIAAVNAFEHDYQAAKLHQPIDPHEWHMTPQTVNAYYNPTQNEIVFPAAILQAPFFDPDADSAQNFGAIGAVIGHEIGHGFDDQGAKFDGKGRINNWWSKRDEEEFSARTQSLIDFYNSFSPAQLPDDYTVNGALTIGENIGDLGGLTIAYKAWLLSCEDEGDDPTPERKRLFFYSWAYVWRTKVRDELAIQLLTVDPHSPAEFRCNGVVSHSDAFAEAFDLQPSDMLWLEPEKRVHIW